MSRSSSYLLRQAIDLTSKMALRDQIPSDKTWKEEIVTVLGFLRAIEALQALEADDVIVKLRAKQSEDQDLLEVKKIERRLKLWCRKPQQINCLILKAFLRLRHEDDVYPVPLNLLKERYLLERFGGEGNNLNGDDRGFDNNFWLMRTLGQTNHGKVFDIDDKGMISIWPRAQAAVETFRNAVGIGS